MRILEKNLLVYEKPLKQDKHGIRSDLRPEIHLARGRPWVTQNQQVPIKSISEMHPYPHTTGPFREECHYSPDTQSRCVYKRKVWHMIIWWHSQHILGIVGILEIVNTYERKSMKGKFNMGTGMVLDDYNTYKELHKSTKYIRNIHRRQFTCLLYLGIYWTTIFLIRQ